MATARKAWFRVADSILYENWDHQTIATMVMLMAHLNTRWAREGRSREDAGKTTLGKADLFKITGKGRADVALTSLQRLADVTGMSAERRGDVVEINWPKYPDFQEYPPDRRATDALSASAPASAPAPAKRKKGAERPPDVDPDVEDWEWLVPILGGKRLLAKSTEDELRMWLEVRYDEISARIRSEVEPGKVWDGIKAHAISAWTLYLKTRDPSQRQFYREVSTRQKAASLQALDARLEAQPRASPEPELDLDDDPLRMLKAGANPYAS